MRDAPAHDARADDGDGFHLGHYLPPGSSCFSTLSKLGSDLRMYSARRVLLVSHRGNVGADATQSGRISST